MRRGDGYDLGRMVPYVIVALLLISFVMYMLYTTFVGAQIDTIQKTTEIEELLVVKELYTSANCFAYEDETTERIYPGIIDLAKFYNRDEILNSNKCLKYFDRNVRISINGLSSSKEIEDPITFSKPILTYDGIIYELADLVIEIERGENYIEQAWTD